MYSSMIGIIVAADLSCTGTINISLLSLSIPRRQHYTSGIFSMSKLTIVYLNNMPGSANFSWICNVYFNT